MNPTRASIDALIAERITADPDFRAALIADPRTALTQLTGMDVPDEVTITVHEESPADIHLVLPMSTPLSDEDLELVAGGTWVYDHFPHNCANCNCSGAGG